MRGKKVSSTKNDLSQQPQMLNVNDVNGVWLSRLIESFPGFAQARSERIIRGDNNCEIVLGRDRHAGELSSISYGTKGATQSAAIDIVVGRVSAIPRGKIPNLSSPNAEDELLVVDSNWDKDAARVYLSQKANIDQYIGLVKISKEQTFDNYKNDELKSTVTRDKYTQTLDADTSVGKSAVAIISDHTRIVGKESVKIATKYFTTNARGAQVDLGGIQIIAHNKVNDIKHSLQPMVKGDNLLDGIRTLVDIMEQFQNIIVEFLRAQHAFNGSVIQHRHVGGTPKNPVTTPSQVLNLPDIKTINTQILEMQLKLARIFATQAADFELRYLSPIGDKYINSHWNSVN